VPEGIAGQGTPNAGMIAKQPLVENIPTPGEPGKFLGLEAPTSYPGDWLPGPGNIKVKTSRFIFFDRKILIEIVIFSEAPLFGATEEV